MFLPCLVGARELWEFFLSLEVTLKFLEPWKVISLRVIFQWLLKTVLNSCFLLWAPLWLQDVFKVVPVVDVCCKQLENVEDFVTLVDLMHLHHKSSVCLLPCPLCPLSDLLHRTIFMEPGWPGRAGPATRAWGLCGVNSIATHTHFSPFIKVSQCHSSQLQGPAFQTHLSTSRGSGPTQGHSATVQGK